MNADHGREGPRAFRPIELGEERFSANLVVLDVFRGELQRRGIADNIHDLGFLWTDVDRTACSEPSRLRAMLVVLPAAYLGTLDMPRCANRLGLRRCLRCRGLFMPANEIEQKLRRRRQREAAALDDDSG